MALIVIASANLGYQIITQRIASVRKHIDTLRDPHILALCLKSLCSSLEFSGHSTV
jgi:hypothetical protein